MSTPRLRVGARSDVGLVREGNEDSLYAGTRLIAVADGIGGAVAGEVASAITISTLSPLDAEPEAEDPLAALANAVRSANEKLRDVITADPGLAGMGTTLTAMLWSRGRLGLAHVGDSRAYLMRRGELTQITRDQTFVQMLVDRGEITQQDASSHPQRSVILNALDGRDDVEPHLSLREVRPGDRYLLCSDGLSDYVDEQLVAEALNGDDPQPVAEQLVELALDAGAPDNVSCVVADVVDDDDAPNSGPILGGAVTDPPAASADIAALTDPARARAGAAGQRPQRRTGRGSRAHQAGRARRARGRSIGRRLAVVAGGVVVLVVAAVVGTAVYIRHQWYVAAADSGSTGTLAIYQGVQGSALGINLSRLREHTDVPVSQLPQDDQDRVSDGIPSSSSSSARQIVANLRRDACQLVATSSTPATTPTPLPTWCVS